MKWAQDQGHTVALLTLTVRHTREDALWVVWDRVQGGWESITSGWGSESEQAYAKRQERHEEAWGDWMAGLRPRRPRTLSPRRIGLAEAAGVLGWCRAVEVTIAPATVETGSGYHAHLHVVVVLDQAVVPDGSLATLEHLENLEDGLYRLWSKGVERRGGSVERAPGIDLRLLRGDASEALGAYFTKANGAGLTSADDLAREAVLGSWKTGRQGNLAPFELLQRLHDQGDDAHEAEVAQWREWVHGSRGRKQLTWSKGFRQMVAAAGEDPDAEDEGLARESAEGEGDLVLLLPGDTWRFIRDDDLRHVLLETVEDHGPPAGARLLADHGLQVHVMSPEDRERHRETRRERQRSRAVVALQSDLHRRKSSVRRGHRRAAFARLI